MKILAEIITYNPNLIDLRMNILKIYDQVDFLLIVDNDSSNLEPLKKMISELKIKNCSVIYNENNLGIAKALNQGLIFAKSNNFEWIMTLDQDSMCDENIIRSYKAYLSKKYSEKDIILTPTIIDLNLKHGPHVIEGKQEHSFVDLAITSGSLLNVNVALEIDGFDETLFIDYVDFDFCIKARNKGYTIIKLTDAILYHRLGELKEYNLLVFKVNVTNHSALRRFYLYRNKIILYKRYYKTNFKWVLRNIISSLKVIGLIIFFEEQKKQKLFQVIKGIYQGINTKISP